MKTLLSLLATAAAVLASLTMLGLMLAGSANMTPEAFARHKTHMWLTAAAALASAVAAITLIICGHPGWGAAVGGLPVVIVLSVLIYACLS